MQEVDIEAGLEKAKQFVLAKIAKEFPMLEDVELGKFEIKDDEMIGVFTVKHGDDPEKDRLAFYFHAEKGAVMFIGRV